MFLTYFQKATVRGKQAGYTSFQCKIGHDPEENEKCVRLCREIMGDRDILIVDGNAGKTGFIHKELRLNFPIFNLMMVCPERRYDNSSS